MANRIDFSGAFDASSSGAGGAPVMPFGHLSASDFVQKLNRDLNPSDALFCRANSNAIRWTPGERLDHLFEQACARFGKLPAVVADNLVICYRSLDNRANQIARYLIERGVRAGDRVGLLFDKSVETYAALLAVLKVNAAYVPLDPGLPVDRIRFILGDANIRTIVSTSDFAEKFSGFDLRLVFLDTEKKAIEAKPHKRLTAGEVEPSADQTCYIIYTSGTTGNPKGVIIEHPSICN
ncbi:MAG: AMP-binding protein, partial [Xanthobacteraceae bacterium]